MSGIFVKLSVAILSFLFFGLVIAGIIDAGFSAIWTLVLGIPFVALLCRFYRFVDRLDGDMSKSLKESSPSVPSSISPVTQRASSRQESTPAYRVCQLIWTRSIIFCEHIHTKPSLQSTAYIWTIFFYSITKHIRKQDIVDEIYDQFKVAAEPFIRNDEDKSMTLDYIQSAYWRFRSELNASGIDPRTHDGMGKLWEITVQWAFPNVELSEGAEVGFIYNNRLLVRHALSQYGLKPTEETVYNGTTVPVSEASIPESCEAPSVKSTVQAGGDSASKGCSWFRWLCVAAILICAITIPLAISLDKATTPSNTPVLAELPQPSNGERFLLPSSTCVSPLSIKAADYDDCYFVLSDHNTGSAIMSFYVHAGSTIKLDVPVGTFDIYYASGDSWYGTDLLFGSDAHYQKFDRTFSFSEHSGWSIELQPVTYGNSDIKNVSTEDFPK